MSVSRVRGGQGGRGGRAAEVVEEQGEAGGGVSVQFTNTTVNSEAGETQSEQGGERARL